MQRGISTYLFIDHDLTLDRLTAVRNQGFQRLEILAIKPHFDYHDRKITSEVAAWLQDQESFLHSIHLPHCMYYRHGCIETGLSIAAIESSRRIQAVDEARRALEFTEKTPCPFAVIHMGEPQDYDYPKHLDALYQSLEILVPFASHRSVRLTLENIPNAISLGRICEFLEETTFENLGICFDSGHANIKSDPISEITAAGKWIITTHFHDNHGHLDEHLLPFTGNINWAEVLQSLETISYDGCLLLEFNVDQKDLSHNLKSAWEAHNRLDKCREK